MNRLFNIFSSGPFKKPLLRLLSQPLSRTILMASLMVLIGVLYPMPVGAEGVTDRWSASGLNRLEEPLVTLLDTVPLTQVVQQPEAASINANPLMANTLMANPLMANSLTVNAPEGGNYQVRDRPSSDGIGKFYFGREIAQVMGHRGAAWLERPSRIQEEKPHVLMANLEIQPTDVIADIGAGTGYLTVRLAPKVPQGKVLAVDVQPEMLDLLSDRLSTEDGDDGFKNVELILASESDPHLPPDSVDMAIMLDVYHELEYPYEVMQQVARSLRPGGKMVLVEYRGENPLVPIKRLHKMTEKQARKEMKAVGLSWVETNEELPRQHLMIFEKT